MATLAITNIGLKETGGQLAGLELAGIKYSVESYIGKFYAVLGTKMEQTPNYYI